MGGGFGNGRSIREKEYEEEEVDDGVENQEGAVAWRRVTVAQELREIDEGLRGRGVGNAGMLEKGDLS